MRRHSAGDSPVHWIKARRKLEVSLNPNETAIASTDRWLSRKYRHACLTRTSLRRLWKEAASALRRRLKVRVLMLSMDATCSSCGYWPSSLSIKASVCSVRLALSDRLASNRAHSDSYSSRSVRFEDGKVSLVMSCGRLNSACGGSKGIWFPNKPL